MMDQYTKEALGEIIRIIIAAICGVIIGFCIWGVS